MRLVEVALRVTREKPRMEAIVGVGRNAGGEYIAGRIARMSAASEGVDMDWRDHIVTDPAILCGKPTLKGTRLSVEFVLDLLAAGWDMPSIHTQYPNLTDERIRAVHAYVADIIRNERFYLLPPAKSA
jgi:uncharacterized protein (DUF433 family)